MSAISVWWNSFAQVRIRRKLKTLRSSARFDRFKVIKKHQHDPKLLRSSLALVLLVGLVYTIASLNARRLWYNRIAQYASTVPVDYPYGTIYRTPKDMECLAWKSESGLKPCAHVVKSSETGYCIVKDLISNSVFKLMSTSPGTFGQRPPFSCQDRFLDFVNFRVGAQMHIQKLEREPDPVLEHEGRKPSRGIVMSVNDENFPSMFAVVRRLRDEGCELPVELWHLADELGTVGSALDELVDNYNVLLMKVEDPKISGFLVKVYAVQMSSFDQLLFLDSDNFPLKDPTYLFDTPEFQETGAIFWPDFWHPSFSIFDTGPGGLAWELFGVKCDNEMEQESGQLLVDRKRHAKALSLTAWYGHNNSIVQKLRAVWGDKDLFRLAFKRLSVEYHMIQTLPGLAGRNLAKKKTDHEKGSNFCGQTMVQHDPRGEVIFLHRNTAKLDSVSGKAMTWETIQRYGGVNVADYTVLMDQFRMADTCWYFPNMDDPEMNPKYEEVTFGHIEAIAISQVTALEKRIRKESRARKSHNPLTKSMLKVFHGWT